MFGADNTLCDSRNRNFNFQNTLYDDEAIDYSNLGIIPRTSREIFELAKNKDSNVFISFLEIYNEKIIDLFEVKKIFSLKYILFLKFYYKTKNSKQKELVIRENPLEGIFVEGLTEYSVNNASECIELMKRGEKNRKIRYTSMNIKSSRSHTIIQFMIESKKADINGNLKAKENFLFTLKYFNRKEKLVFVI